MTLHDYQGIVANPDLLGEEYIPPNIPGRDPQIEELTYCLAPAIRGRKPMHSWVYGNPGTGKTATTRYLLRKLKHESAVNGVYINCWECNTFYGVIEKIVLKLRILGADKLNTAFKLERFERYIKDRPFIIVLDEIDQPSPKERNSILYNLCNLGRVGLVCVCNSKYTLFGLEERVKSRLSPTRIEFRRYSIDELIYILRQRAQWALFPDTWDKQVLEHIAELSEGDARVAIQTMKNAAYYAENDSKSFIQPEYVKKGWNSAKDLKKTYMLNKLTVHHRLLYELIEKNGEILSGKLWTVYLNACRKKRMKPIALRTYSDYTNKLKELGLIKAERASVRGKVRVLRTNDG